MTTKQERLYTVRVVGTSPVWADITVSASSVEEARDKASETDPRMSADWELSEGNGVNDWEIDVVMDENGDDIEDEDEEDTDQIEDGISCEACGLTREDTQREAKEIGYTGNDPVCCEMLLERNLEVNA